MDCLKAFALILVTVTVAQAGPDDTISQLEVGYGNLDMTKSYSQVPVETVDGMVPEWLSGSFVRHGKKRSS
jgi:hypothetical protein